MQRPRECEDGNDAYFLATCAFHMIMKVVDDFTPVMTKMEPGRMEGMVDGNGTIEWIKLAPSEMPFRHFAVHGGFLVLLYVPRCS